MQNYRKPVPFMDVPASVSRAVFSCILPVNSVEAGILVGKRSGRNDC